MKSKPRSGAALMMAAVVALLTIDARAFVSAQQTIRIRVTDRARPVSEAVRQLENLFGQVITYEDASYVHPSDIVDVTDKVSRERSGTQRVLVMRNGSIDVALNRRDQSVSNSVGLLLRLILQDSERAGNAGEFRAEWIDGAFHVIPDAIKGKDGKRQLFRPILDTLITLPPHDGNGFEFVERVAKALTNASGRDIRAGMMPRNLARSRVYSAANGEVARLVLWRGLRALGPQLSWQMLCSVGEAGFCTLNVHPVPTLSGDGD